MNISKLEKYIISNNGSVSDRQIKISKKNIIYPVPKIYYELLKLSNGGILNCEFEYYDEGLKYKQKEAISFFYGIERGEYNYDYDFLINYFYLPESCPDDVLPFASTKKGGKLCFDYRSNLKNIDPEIIYWNSTTKEGKNISLVARNFDQFISLLKGCKSDNEYEELSEEELDRHMSDIYGPNWRNEYK